MGFYQPISVDVMYSNSMSSVIYQYLCQIETYL